MMGHNICFMEEYQKLSLNYLCCPFWGTVSMKSYVHQISKEVFMLFPFVKLMENREVRKSVLHHFWKRAGASFEQGIYSQTCLCGHLYLGITCLKQPHFLGA